MTASEQIWFGLPVKLLSTEEIILGKYQMELPSQSCHNHRHGSFFRFPKRGHCAKSHEGTVLSMRQLPKLPPYQDAILLKTSE